MNLEPTPEQRQLKDSVAKLLGAKYRFEARQEHTRSERGWSEPLWKHYADLGLLAIAVPESCGGLGGGAADLLPVMAEMGKALVLEPFFASAVLGASALAAAHDEGIKEKLLPLVATGEHLLAFAHDPLGAAGPDDSHRVSAVRVDGGWTLTGRSAFVLNGADAHSIVVSASDATSREIGLFLVSAQAAGVSRRSFRLVDQRGAAELRFAGVEAKPLIEPGAAAAALRQTVNLGLAALCAEAVGCIRAALEMAVAYMKERKQFGRALSEYQVLRHRAADILVSVETCEGLALLAAAAVDAPDSADPLFDLSAAKLLVGRRGREACEQVIQLHGAIAMTDEYAAGHYLQRLMVIDRLLGDQDAHLNLLQDLSARRTASSNPLPIAAHG
jgi:alkylation response protein AidB-like acyl-CoA dehydrogenase